MILGRRRELGLGGFPLVSLAEAREKAFANRKLAREGGNPLTGRVRTEGIPTFAVAAERVWHDKRAGWRHPQHAQDWLSSLRRHVLPHIGDVPVCDVTSADILETLRRVWHVRPETARRIRQRIYAVMEWCGVAMHLRDDNPCDRLGKVLGPQQDIVPAHAGAALSRRGGGGRDGVRVGGHAGRKAGVRVPRCSRPRGRGKCAAHGGVRLIGPARVWTIPARRMKSKREHRIPLTGRGSGDSHHRAKARRRARSVRVSEPGRQAESASRGCRGSCRT